MIELLNMDCMDYLKQCKDNEFDLAIVDPPYGIGIDGQKESKKGKKSDRKLHVKKGWDDKIPEQSYFDELKRVSKNQIIWGANYFITRLNKNTKGWIVWDKGQYGLTMSDCELAYTTFEKPTRVYNKNRMILQQEGGTIHPTQKPIHLYKWLLENYAKPEMKILDTHLGSGSSAIAAHYFGCDFVGIELDKDYFEAAQKRFEQQTAQMDMF